MPSPLTLARGQVISAFFPFSEIDDGKSRRCMVLGWSCVEDDMRVLLVPITTHGGHPERATANEIQLNDQPEADVDENSFLQPSHFASLKLTALAPKHMFGRLTKATVAAAIVEASRMLTTDEQAQVKR